MPFEDGSFGTVFVLTSWAFLDDTPAVLAEARRVLVAKGMFVNGYLDRDGIWGAGYLEKGRQGHGLFRHARFASYAEVVGATREAGFRVERTVSTLFSGPGEQSTPEPPREGFERGASFVVVVARRA